MNRSQHTPNGRPKSAVQLLAKAPRNGQPGRTLAEHTCDVMVAFQSLFGRPDQPSDLAHSWRRFFQLESLDAFLRDGLAAAACHDWGKANNGFQDMLLNRRSQILRHEQISALLILWPSIWEWLGTNPTLDRELLLAAVAGHHLKTRSGTFGQPQGDTDTLLRIYWDHPASRRGWGSGGRSQAQADEEVVQRRPRGGGLG